MPRLWSSTSSPSTNTWRVNSARAPGGTPRSAAGRPPRARTRARSAATRTARTSRPDPNLRWTSTELRSARSGGDGVPVDRGLRATDASVERARSMLRTDRIPELWMTREPLRRCPSSRSRRMVEFNQGHDVGPGAGGDVDKVQVMVELGAGRQGSEASCPPRAPPVIREGLPGPPPPTTPEDDDCVRRCRREYVEFGPPCRVKGVEHLVRNSVRGAAHVTRQEDLDRIGDVCGVQAG